MEEDLRPVGNEVPPPDAPRPDPMQMQAQLTTLTELVRGLMTVVECLDGRNSMLPLEDAPMPQEPTVAGDPNYGDHPHIQEGTGDSENHRGLPRPRPSQSSGSRLGLAGLRAPEDRVPRGPGNPEVLSQNPGGNLPGDSGSVRAGGQARGGPNAQRGQKHRE
ncbi:hypothetical protein L484_002570 [Morus notabilis]|uniref:Uncharacterized protein n=1 Tax=Morus notabilis TaxID=981085 RepID=W9QHN4_9ROSA|nr:hypothetical protein L484_002570 [Morus notabilis]